MDLEDIIILLDTEYTSWEGCQENGWKPEKNQYREIIQLSAIKIKKKNNQYHIIDTFDYLIIPHINPVLSSYITNLTGITNLMMNKDGKTFTEVINKFKLFCDEYTIYSYGDDFKSVIVDYNCKLYLEKLNIDYFPLIKNWNNNKDIRYFFKSYGIDTKSYTSGEIYLSQGIVMDNINIHNALFDVKSMLVTINHLIL